MVKRAWYIGCSTDQIAERVILIGDPDRVGRLSAFLDDVQTPPVSRGLYTVTGKYNDVPVTMTAFGMGAPIAAIVMHELADIGAKAFLRVGTSMCLPPTETGDFIVADRALSYEGTSRAYNKNNLCPRASPDLVASVLAASETLGHPCSSGKFASFDGFYRDMFALDDVTRKNVQETFVNLTDQNVSAIDMETSALLTVGNTIGCKISSLCVSSVNGMTQYKIPKEQMLIAEKMLAKIALLAITSVSLGR